MPIVNNRSARDGRREWGRIRKRGENRPEFKLQRNPAREGGGEGGERDSPCTGRGGDGMRGGKGDPNDRARRAPAFGPLARYFRG